APLAANNGSGRPAGKQSGCRGSGFVGDPRILGLLREIVPQFLEEALAPGADLRVIDLGELPEQLLLSGRQVPRGLDHDLDQLVTPTAAADIGHAAPLDPDHLAALCAARNHDLLGSVERGVLDLGAQRGLGKADRDLGEEVVPPPLEKRMSPDHHLNTQVAPRRSDVSQFALVAKLQPHAAFHARWNIDLELARRRSATGASAMGTGIGDSDPITAAGRAGGRHLKEAACLNDLAPAATIVASRGARPLARARAAAVAAKLLAAHFDSA